MKPYATLFLVPQEPCTYPYNPYNTYYPYNRKSNKNGSRDR